MLPLLLLPLLAVCCFGPGFFLLRRARLSIDERICGSIAISLLLLYLAGWGIYLSRMNWHGAWAATLVLMAISAIGWRELGQFVRRPPVQHRFAAFGMLLGIGLLGMALIRHYSGGSWGGDWKEHYDRTLFFLNHAPYDTVFIHLYVLPARPPMMHLIAAYFLGLFDSGYDSFQIISLFLSALVIFPCVLLAGLIIRGGGRRVWLIAAMLALSPVFIQNATLTWNKLLAAFFVILSTSLYLRGWRRPSPNHILAAAGAMACGTLVHYSAGPYAVFLFGHYLINLVSRRRRTLEILGSAGVVTILLATWFVWSFAIYGAHDTFASNTTATGAQDRTPAENLVKIAGNLYSSTMPFPIGTPYREFFRRYNQPNDFGYVRDHYFLLSQQNFPLTQGPVGWIAAIYLLLRLLRTADRAAGRFWIGFIVVTFFLGVAVVGERDRFGVAQASLQPLTIMGLVLLAAGMPLLRTWMKLVLLASIAIHAAMGIVLQLRMEMNLLNYVRIGKDEIVPISRGLMSLQSIINSQLRLGANATYFADQFVLMDWLIVTVLIVALAGAIYLVGRSISGRNVGIAAAMLLVVGSVLCVSDRQLGYRVTLNLPYPADASPDQLRQILEPLVREVRANPESAEAHYRLAEANLHLDRLADCWTETIDAMLLDPNYPPAHYLLTTFIFIYRANDQGGMELPQALYDGTYMADAPRHIAYGMEALAHGFDSKARQILKLAVERYPQEAGGHDGMGIVLTHEGHMVEAIREFETAVRLAPDSPLFADHLSRVMQGMGSTPAQIAQRIAELRSAK